MILTPAVFELCFNLKEQSFLISMIVRSLIECNSCREKSIFRFSATLSGSVRFVCACPNCDVNFTGIFHINLKEKSFLKVVNDDFKVIHDKEEILSNRYKIVTINTAFPVHKLRDQESLISRFGSRSTKQIIRLVIGLVAIAILFAATPALAQPSIDVQQFNPQGFLRNALQWIEHLGPKGAIAFILIYIIATVAFLPGAILTLSAGVIFGVVLGSIYVFVGATLGATAAFLVGRYLARGWVSKKIESNENFKAIDQAVGKEGFKIVLLTRLSPVFPFNLLNYAFGVTGVSLKDFFFGCIGIIPGTIMYVYIGSLASSLALIGAENQPTNLLVTWAIRIVGLIATVTVTIYVTHIARKALENKVS